jgi:hypothetical protein
MNAMTFLFLVWLLVCLTITNSLGAKIRTNIVPSEIEIVAKSSEVVRKDRNGDGTLTQSPLEQLKELLVVAKNIRSNEQLDDERTKVSARWCSIAAKYERTIQTMFESKIAKTTAYMDLLQKEKKRCTGLMSLLTVVKNDAEGDATLRDTKLHCESLNRDFVNVKSEINLYSTSLHQVQKVLTFLVKPCNLTRSRSFQRSASRDNMVKNLNAISKQANHKVSVLYSTIDSTISTPLNLSNLYNRRGERLLDILITKSMLLNLSSHNKLSLQLSQISELRAAKNRFMKDRSKYMAMTQTNIATKLLLGKYTLLYKELQMKINATKNLLEIDQGGSSKAFAINKHFLRNGNIKKEELLQNLTHLLGLKEKMSDKIKSVAEESKRYQKNVTATHKNAINSESVYLTKISTVLHQTRAPKNDTVQMSEIMGLIPTIDRRKEKLANLSVSLNITYFDKIFQTMIKFELAKRKENLVNLKAGILKTKKSGCASIAKHYQTRNSTNTEARWNRHPGIS